MPYPLPVFHFSVSWAGGPDVSFSEVTGLNMEIQMIEYRDGARPEYSTVKMPGLRKYGNVTMKRGVFADDNAYFDWVKTIKLNKPERRDVTISLLNEEHMPVMTWTLLQAWPTKITSPDLKANANEAAIETIELAHEGIEIKNPP
jgi:phage tail-like protein